MSLSHLLRKFSHTNPARPAPDSGPEDPSSENSHELPQTRRQATEPGPTVPRLWAWRAPSTDDRFSSSLTLTPRKSTTETPTLGARVYEEPLAGPSVLHSSSFMEFDQEVTSPAPMYASDKLIETWNLVKRGISDSDLNQKLNALDDTATALSNNFSQIRTFTTTVAGDVGKTAIAKSVKEGIDKFFDGMPVFMNALDAVADIHPFINVAVLAFKTVYTLELKRRENEKKIIALYVEMKDMMSALLILKDVENEKLIAPDGTIKDRLKSLVHRTADDIKECSNSCDTYIKKRLLAKVLLGSSWDATFLEFVKLFTKRRREFEFELSIHTSRSIDEANAKLDTIWNKTHDLNDKMDVMIGMFQQLVSPEQKQISALVDTMGGVSALRNNDKKLLHVEETASKVSGTPSAESRHAPRPGAKPADAKLNAEDIKNDVFEDPNAAAEKNQIVFFRKFKAQQNQILDELSLVVKREGDRVIEEVRGGPHERIIDPSIHEIWKEMAWRGNVKARHFVLAFRDYYLEKLAPESTSIRGICTSTITASQHPDAWAIKFIDIIRLQPILEAIDDDASGFITIEEMNRFTISRPADWSLPHWAAFWAVGYRASIIDYANKIEGLFAKMEGVRANVLPPNREAIDDYFTYVWEPVHTLTAAALSLQPGLNNSDKFKPYLEAEEARIDANLKAVDYILDGIDTLALITGVGRIEKSVFPVLYLLMKRHYEIMRIMRIKVLDSRELWHSVESVLFVHDAIGYRVDDLTNIFSQQKHDPGKEFQNFAHGIFKYFHDGKALWSVDYVRSLNPPVIPYNDANEDQNVKLEDILKYEYMDDLSLDNWVYDGHSIDDIPNYRNVEPPLKDILGHWHGYFYESEGIRETDGTDSMVTLVLEPAEGDHAIQANAWSNRGRFTVFGSWSKGENNVMRIKLKMTFKSAFWATMFFNGRFDPERDALTGVWDASSDPENSSGPMEFRRILPHYLTVYPSIKELSDNKPRALWKFAIAAVRNDLRRDRWSWSYFSQRRDDREAVISLTIRSLFFGTPPGEGDVQRLCAAVQRLTPADACFYFSRINRIRAYTWVHANAWCDSCDGCIGGARLFCLDCANKTTEAYNALDLCSAPECIAARVTNRQDLEGVHEPSHKLVKVRTAVLKRQHGRAHTAAEKAFERVEPFCKKIAELSKWPEKEKSTLTVKSVSSSKSSNDYLVNGLLTPNGIRGDPKVNVVGATARELSPQTWSNELPVCGNCEGALSFPFWYCIFCQDNLFICNSCDMDGVPDLTRCLGKHTEEHHLIRCMLPETVKEQASSAEQRLKSLEERFDNMEMRLGDLSDRIGNIEQLLQRLANMIG